MKQTLGNFRGINFRKTLSNGVTIIEGYDNGSRVIYAMSEKEFRSKVAAWLDRGETNQQVYRGKARRSMKRALSRSRTNTDAPVRASRKVKGN